MDTCSACNYTDYGIFEYVLARSSMPINMVVTCIPHANSPHKLAYESARSLTLQPSSMKFCTRLIQFVGACDVSSVATNEMKSFNLCNDKYDPRAHYLGVDLFAERGLLELSFKLRYFQFLYL